MTATTAPTVRTVSQLFDLTGKTALITGGSRGLGLQMAHALGEAGARVMLSSRKADDLEQATADLQAAGVLMAVATSKAETTAQRILAHFGLDGHFEVIAGASNDGTRAAKSDVVAHVLAQLAPVPDNVVMIGDRSHDVEGAAVHGIATIVVGWGYGRTDFAGRESGALAHVTDVDDLREVLGV